MKIKKIEPSFIITLTAREALVLVGIAGICGADKSAVNEKDIYFDVNIAMDSNPVIKEPTFSREVITAIGQALEDLGVRY